MQGPVIAISSVAGIPPGRLHVVKTLWPALVLVALAAVSGPTALAGPFPQTCDEIDASGCRTVVVIGDTQDIADYETRVNGAFPRRAWLEAMIDWVIANRAQENVDFVLQVGDITEHGWWLPMSSGCLNACSAPLCHCPAEVAEEWSVFDAQIRRLESAGMPAIRARDSSD